MKNVAIVAVVRNFDDNLYTFGTAKKFFDNGFKVWFEDIHKGQMYADNFTVADSDTVFKNAELIVVLGGDGTILRAAEKALKYDLPILGINLGRLGYMAELEKDELSQIDNLFSDNFGIEKRMTLSVDVVTESGESIYLGDVLNDVVVCKGKYAHCIDIDLFADKKPVRTIRSDGLIISTPTGSTAYSMAAGGSVLDPTLECICATPIVPISRYACPLIFSGDSVLEVFNNDERAEEWSLLLDGVEKYLLRCGDKISIKKSDKFVKMITLKNESFFETLNNKISKYELKK